MSTAYHEYIRGKSASILGQDILSSLTDPMQIFIGSPNWSISALRELVALKTGLEDEGGYIGLCGNSIYVGSSGCFQLRLWTHQESIETHRSTQLISVSLWYEQCSSGAAKHEEVSWIYAAISANRREVHFLEVLESVLISILGVFKGGRLLPMVLR